MLKLGDMAAARLLFKAGAEAGDVQCLIAVGTTYDPLVLQKRGLKSVYADPAEAMAWYTKAKDAGSEQAIQRLDALRGWLNR